MIIRVTCLLSVLGCLSASCFAAEFKTASFAGTQATVIDVDPSTESIQLFLRDDTGRPIETLQKLDSWVKNQGNTLVFAMNAGMFQPDLSPVGLYVSDGSILAHLNTANGTGNFFLKPNGIFFIENGIVGIEETTTYQRVNHKPSVATQSGPMLVVGGKIHPKFKAESESRLVRNGVGLTFNRHVLFVITEGPVNLYEFAALFTHKLHCREALYLDGTVSSLYAPQLGRSDYKTPLGPMIGVVR